MILDAPLFSIITVCFNAEKTLPRTLLSVREQLFRDFEYLVIDGGSTDNTRDLVRVNLDLIRDFVSEPDRGISDAFNKGIARARGRYIGLLNADDWYDPTALRDAATAIKTHTPDVLCGRQRYFEDGVPVALYETNPSLLRDFMSVNHAASFSLRKLYEEHGGFKLEYELAMDYELYLRFFTLGAKFVRTDAVLANMSLGGTSDRNWRRAMHEMKQVQLEHGVPFLKAEWNYLFQMAKAAGRRSAQRVGLQSVVDFYRRRLTRVPKC